MTNDIHTMIQDSLSSHKIPRNVISTTAVMGQFIAKVSLVLASILGVERTLIWFQGGLGYVYLTNLLWSYASEGAPKFIEQMYAIAQRWQTISHGRTGRMRDANVAFDLMDYVSATLNQTISGENVTHEHINQFIASVTLLIHIESAKNEALMDLSRDLHTMVESLPSVFGTIRSTIDYAGRLPLMTKDITARLQSLTAFNDTGLADLSRMMRDEIPILKRITERVLDDFTDPVSSVVVHNVPLYRVRMIQGGGTRPGPDLVRPATREEVQTDPEWSLVNGVEYANYVEDPASESIRDIARKRFSRSIMDTRDYGQEFETKYGVRLPPASTGTDLLNFLGSTGPLLETSEVTQRLAEGDNLLVISTTISLVVILFWILARGVQYVHRRTTTGQGVSLAARPLLSPKQEVVPENSTAKGEPSSLDPSTLSLATATTSQRPSRRRGTSRSRR